MSVQLGQNIFNGIVISGIYLLIALLRLTTVLIGVAFQKTLYKGEDAADALWRKRPAWLRPVAGGLLLGLLLLALRQMYGVGYPVMDRVLANQEVLWFVVILMLGVLGNRVGNDYSNIANGLAQ